MINKIWGGFILIGILFFFLTMRVNELNQTILDSVKASLDMVISLVPVLALWLGIMNIARVSGLLGKVSCLISPLLVKIFPEIPKGHESFGYISSNIIANMFGLGNAATPFGLKAMQSLQELNGKKDVASRSMITFLVINTSGVTIIPTTIISMRMMHGSSEPTSIVLACILASVISVCGGLLIDRLLAGRSK